MSNTVQVPQGPTIRQDIDRVAADVLEKAQALSAATLHEAGGRIGVLPSAIKPVAPKFKICGPAVTVQGPSGDNLWLHRAIYVARPGDVLVADVGGNFDFGYWGEIMSVAAQARGLGGLVINGCVRDAVPLETVGFPIFARGLCIRGTGKDFGAQGWINYPLLMDGVTVNPGDLIFGDTDGVVAIPREKAADIVAASIQREAKEADIMDKLRQGGTTLELYNF